MQEKINIFDLELERYKLYGITVSNRKQKQTQNITPTFKVYTLLENIEIEYICKLQWVTKYEKEKIVKFLRRSIGRKININKNLFYDFEGGEIEKINLENFVKVISNFEEVEITNKNNGFFDMTIKLKNAFVFDPKTYKDLKAYTYKQLHSYTYNQIQTGGVK